MQFRGQGAVLERQRDLGFQRLNHVVEALEVPPIHGLDLLQFNVAGHVLFGQEAGEARGVELAAGAQPDAGVPDLVRVQFWSKAMDFGIVQPERGGAQVGAADGFVIRRCQGVDLDRECPALERLGRVAVIHGE